MQVQVIGLVICAVLSAAFAEVYFEEKFKDGMYSIILFFLSIFLSAMNNDFFLLALDLMWHFLTCQT